jgi:hypothetical protein
MRQRPPLSFYPKFTESNWDLYQKGAVCLKCESRSEQLTAVRRTISGKRYVLSSMWN